MKLKNGILAFASLSLLVTPLSALASSVVPAWDFNNPGNNSFTNGDWTLGEVFVPTQNITVTALGAYGTAGDFSSDVPVGIFNASGDLLVSTTITNSSSIVDDVNGSQSDNFVFNTVAATELLAGQTYVIEAVSGSNNYVWNDTDFTVYAPINVEGDNYVENAGLTFNGTGLINDVSDGYWGADFVAAPEPGGLLLLGSGLTVFAGMLRRKLKA